MSWARTGADELLFFGGGVEVAVTCMYSTGNCQKFGMKAIVLPNIYASGVVVPVYFRTFGQCGTEPTYTVA